MSARWQAYERLRASLADTGWSEAPGAEDGIG
jgi:hypothetical protein